jgi:hypothetical protein
MSSGCVRPGPRHTKAGPSGVSKVTRDDKPWPRRRKAASSVFAEATTGQDLRNRIGSHMRAFEFFGRTTEIGLPENLKSAVAHPSYYEPDLNPADRDRGTMGWRSFRIEPAELLAP